MSNELDKAFPLVQTAYEAITELVALFGEIEKNEKTITSMQDRHVQYQRDRDLRTENSALKEEIHRLRNEAQIALSRTRLDYARQQRDKP